MRLHVYFARRFLSSFLGVTAIFVVMLTLLDLIEQIRRFADFDITLTDALTLTLLSVPEVLYRLLPLVVLLATIALFVGLARSSELVVTRAAGRSAIRTVVSPVIAALLLGVLAITVFNPIVAATKQTYEDRAENFRSGGERSFSVSAEGLWMRQTSQTGQTVIHAVRANPGTDSFSDVTFVDFTPQSVPVRRIIAERAELGTTSWTLHGAKVWPLDAANPEVASEFHETLTIPATLTRSQIRDSFSSPEAIALWDLPAFIATLQSAGFSGRLHTVWFHSQLALPFFLAGMVLIGCGFTMRHARFGGTGILVLYALASGFTAYFLRTFAEILGQNAQIPAELAAWAPPIAVLLSTIGLLLHLEDG